MPPASLGMPRARIQHDVMGVALCKPNSHALRMWTNVRPKALCRCNKLDSFRDLRVGARSAGGAVASRECHGEAAHDGTV